MVQVVHALTLYTYRRREMSVSSSMRGEWVGARTTWTDRALPMVTCCTGGDNLDLQV